MENTIATLEKLILDKVDEGLFPSVEDAVESISQWLHDLELHYIEEQMRNEDA